MGLKRVLIVSVGMRVCVLFLAIGFVCFRYMWGVKTETIPLIKAASEGNTDQVTLLLERGEFASPQDPDGNTPLHFCVYNGRYENNRKVLKMLLMYQANVRARNKAGQLPAHLIGHIDDDKYRMEVFGWLIKFGYNIDARDNQGYTVLDKISEQYTINGTKLLLDLWGSIISKEMIESAQQIAQKDGYRDVVDILKKKITVLGADGNSDAWDKRTGLNGLHLAVIRGDEAMIADLLGRGAKINAPSKDEFAFAPLHFAILHQKDTIVSLLLERGAQVNIVDAHGNTPLHLVAFVRNPALGKKCVELLLNRGAQINAKNKNGDVLLHTLVRNNSIELISFLAKKYKGLDKNSTNKALITPIGLARQLNRTEIINVLR